MSSGLCIRSFLLSIGRFFNCVMSIQTFSEVQPVLQKPIVPAAPAVGKSLPIRGLATTVGNTPLLPLQRIAGHLWPRVQLHAKAEWFNPGGSVKDRPALSIIQAALAAGDLDGGVRLLDSTSGNMGISYATLGAALDIPVTLTVPGNASPERLSILRALGAEVVLTDPLEGSDGAMLVAAEMAAAHPDRYFYANQYNNSANWQSHFFSTGPEIWRQTERRVTHFVAGLGTSGTLTGVTHYLKSKNRKVRSIAMQPDSPFHGLEGLKHMPSAQKPGIFDPTLPDETVTVSTEAAYTMTRRLAREEGLFVGISAGAAVQAALTLAENLSDGVVVTLLPDAGYKYLSNSIWEQA